MISLHQFAVSIKLLDFVPSMITCEEGVKRHVGFVSEVSHYRSSHRDSFSKYQCSFFPGATFLQFSRRVYLFAEQTFFSRRLYMFFEQTQIFQEGLSKRRVFSRRVYLFIKRTLLSHRADTNFARNPYLVLEHVHIFQEPLFSHRTDINFPGSSI